MEDLERVTLVGRRHLPNFSTVSPTPSAAEEYDFMLETRPYTAKTPVSVELKLTFEVIGSVFSEILLLLLLRYAPSQSLNSEVTVHYLSGFLTIVVTTKDSGISKSKVPSLLKSGMISGTIL